MTDLLAPNAEYKPVVLAPGLVVPNVSLNTTVALDEAVMQRANNAADARRSSVFMTGGFFVTQEFIGYD
jgi:hypothetical protein